MTNNNCVMKYIICSINAQITSTHSITKDLLYFQITTTHNTYMSESVSQTGTYYTTVVAYNNALGPSHPVCSDGVTIDTTGPSVASVHVNHAFVKPGLVTDGQTIMYMDEEGFVYQLATQTEDCR